MGTLDQPTGAAAPPLAPLTRTGSYAILIVAFLGWLWAGVHMSTTQLTGTAASVDLLARTGELDSERFKARTQQAKTEPGGAALSAEDREQLDRGKALVGRW